MSRHDRFTQPEDGIEIISTVAGPRTLLTPDIIEEGRMRIAVGENPADVARSLALYEAELLAGMGALPSDVIEFETVALAAKPASQKQLHALADKHEKRISLATRYAFAVGRKALRANHDADAVAEAVKKALLDALPKTLMSIYMASKEVTKIEPRAAAGPTKIKQSLGTPADPHAIEWASQRATELAKDLSNTTREKVSDALVAFLKGESSMKDVEDAVGDDDRAELIARTETMTALNEGQRGAWDDAVEAGLLPDDAKRVWIAAPGCCDDCEELDGETADLDGEYPNDGGDGPPLHPNCRCTEGIAS
jgi:hypothetical protein